MAYTMTVDEARAHAGGSLKGVPAVIAEQIRGAMPLYLWVLDDEENRRRRDVHCEGCGLTREERRGRAWPHAFPQGKEIRCPWCGAPVTVKHTGRGFSGLRDRLDAVWYMKSAVDPDAVVAFGAYCERDFGAYSRYFNPWQDAPPWTVEVDVDVRSLCVIVPGRGGFRFKEKVMAWEMVGGHRNAWIPSRLEWVPVKRSGPLTFGDTNGGAFFNLCRPRRIILTDTLSDAVAGTPLGRAWRDEYLLNDRGMDGAQALGFIAQYPCVEYMTKLGMTEFLPAKLTGDLPAGEVNWRGKSMASVLKLKKQRLGELKHAGITLTPALLALLHWLDREGISLPVRAAENVAILADRHTSAGRVPAAVERALSCLPAECRRKALKYMNRQAEKIADARLQLGDFIDYWGDCADFGENLLDDAVAFPSDIRAAEGRFEERRRREREAKDAAESADADKAIARKWPKLQELYGFSFGGLTLRPARDSAEVRREGRELHHCVGGYVKRYARGDTVICVLRRDCDPDMPFRTVEISARGRLVQDRGYHNDAAGFGIPVDEHYRAALNLFWEAWEERTA